MTVQPGQKDLAFFESFETSDFVRWLQVGLEGIILEDKGGWAFGKIGVFLGGRPFPAEGLLVIYDALSAGKKAFFRQAVANLLDSLGAKGDAVLIFEQLLLLAAQMPAPEVFAVLPKRIGQGFFGRSDLPHGKNLFNLTLTIASQMAAPTDEVLETIHALIESRRFESRHAGQALIALCRADPLQFSSHIEKCDPFLVNMFQTYADHVERQKIQLDLTGRIVEAVPMNVLRDFVNGISPHIPREDEPYAWFVMFLPVTVDFSRYPRKWWSAGQLPKPKSHTEAPATRVLPDSSAILPDLQSRKLLGPGFWQVATKTAEENGESVEVTAS